MEKEFVPYELAVKLKKLGFDEPCFGAYHNENYLDLKSEEYDYSYAVKAPTFSQAFRWFRKEYGYWSYLKEATKGTCRFYIEKFDEKFFNSDIIDTYEEAESACLDKLIEIVEAI